jgi:hypothetical protein
LIPHIAALMRATRFLNGKANYGSAFFDGIDPKRKFEKELALIYCSLPI